ncbi:MAG: tetratricopeptide repeat protein [Proteobacteria bacterium]|nr:tetratricopeptide repeat protein [Pseudomonadota bacterium]
MSARPMNAVFVAARFALWGMVYLFILAYLHPELILKDAIVTGGDTASHYYTAVYLRDYLLPHGRLVGWQPGNYAGFPVFQMYFPLPFLGMALLGLALPLTVAFKIVSVAGILGLPPAAAYFLKRLGFRPPAGDLGAVCSLAFLFLESNSAWGGNIPSTLAGEFTYSLGLALVLVYLGRMFRDVPRGDHVVSNALLLALTGLCHGYTLLFGVLGISFFLWNTDRWTVRMLYILKVNILAFCLMGFWIVPLLLFAPYGTAYNFVWSINHWREVMPEYLWPFAGLGLAGAAGMMIAGDPGSRRAMSFAIYLTAVAVVFYFTAFEIGVVDVRFLPFALLLPMLMGAAAAGRVLEGLKGRWLAALALTLAALAWIAQHETYIGRWAAWNFSGYENKPLWPAFNQLNAYLKGGFEDPRIVYEHAPETRDVGSLRAFESLPLFAGRATLEGLYIQSNLSSPFVFYIQSQVSPAYSAPLTQTNYARFDLESARSRLRLFNTGQYVTVTEKARLEAMRQPGYSLEKEFPPFAVFKVRDNPDRYVSQPKYLPILDLTSRPERDSLLWFRRADLDLPLVFAEKAGPLRSGRFAVLVRGPLTVEALADLPKIPLPDSPDLRETVRNEEIVIEGAVPGRPLWVRVSYHPNWRVEGADRVWRAAPSFMLIFPTSDRVRLRFGRTWPDYLGLVLTLAGIWYAVSRRRTWHVPVPEGRPSFDPEQRILAALDPIGRRLRPHGRAVLISVGFVCVTSVLFVILAVHHRDPAALYRRGLNLADQGDRDGAREVFEEAVRNFPYSPAIDQTLHQLALTFYNQGRYEEAAAVWSRFETQYPESRLLDEALYHLGLARMRQNRFEDAERLFRRLETLFPESARVRRSAGPMAEMERSGWRVTYDQAMDLFDRKRYLEAERLFARVRDKAHEQPLTDRAAYFVAVCRFKDGRLNEARTAFNELIVRQPTGPFAAEAGFHLALIALRQGETDRGRSMFESVIRDYPDSRWSIEARRMLDSPEMKVRP